MEVNAHPQHISELKDADIQPILRTLGNLVSMADPIGEYLGANIYEFTVGGREYVVLATTEILYFVRHTKISKPVTAGRQLLVWRDKEGKDQDRSTGFATHVFFKVLLPHYKVLAADRQQTDYGRSFWMRTLDRAFDRGLHVYVVDHQTEMPKVRKFKAFGELLSVKSQIWGAEEWFQDIIPVISESPLSF